MVPRSFVTLTLLAATALPCAFGASDPPTSASGATAFTALGDPKPPEKPKAKPPAPKPPEKPKAPPAGKDTPKDPPKDPPKPKPIGIGNEVDAALTLHDIEGKAHKLADLRGKTVVVQFWSAHTSASYDKRIAELATSGGAKGVVFVAIDADKADVEGAKDPAVALREALKAHGLEGKLPLVFDRDGALAKQFNASSTAPHAFVIDAKGVLRYSGAIDDDPAGTKKEGVKHYLADAIEAVVGGKPVPVATTTPGDMGKK